MCFMDLEKAVDRVSRRLMQWTLKKKKGQLEILVKVVMNLNWYMGSKTKVKDGSKSVVPKVGATAPQGALVRFRGAVERKGAIGGR